MRLLRSFVVAFSMYSRIPMPRFAWKEEDMTYMLCFFPFVGLVIGALFTGWHALCCEVFGPAISPFFATAVAAVIPLLVTGGFHLDGFMDTSDALSSFGEREKKLAILKDSHIGAFAVIRTAICGLLYLGATNQILLASGQAVLAAAFVFVLARIFSALAAVNFQNARKEGMLFFTTSGVDRRWNNLILLLELLLTETAAVFLCRWYGAAILFTAVFVFLYYKLRSDREFGGITGDLEGYFVVLCETACMLVLAFFSMWLG